MKILIIGLIILAGCSQESIHYIPAPIDSVLTCCGKVSKDRPIKYIISSRGVSGPVETYYKQCTRPQNLFYRVRDVGDGSYKISIVCKLGNKRMIRLSEEIPSE